MHDQFLKFADIFMPVLELNCIRKKHSNNQIAVVGIAHEEKILMEFATIIYCTLIFFHYVVIEL